MGEAARADAERIDALPDNELESLPLAGVPVAIKDDTDVAGQSTGWGSNVDRGLCRHDAEIVCRLRRAGAIIVGKTNVPELTLWPWTASDASGITRNPWEPSRTPGGSSGGSAVAVSTGMAAIGLGSDGGGSIRYPGGLTGLVGLKPQRDRLPVGDEHASGWHGLVVLGPSHPFGTRCRLLPRHRRHHAAVHDLSRCPRPAVVATADRRIDQPAARHPGPPVRNSPSQRRRRRAPARRSRPRHR